jgi:hypothetical protein
MSTVINARNSFLVACGAATGEDQVIPMRLNRSCGRNAEMELRRESQLGKNPTHSSFFGGEQNFPALVRRKWLYSTPAGSSFNKNVTRKVRASC